MNHTAVGKVPYDPVPVKGPRYFDRRDSLVGLFIAVIAKRAHWARPPNPLWARNWTKWGNPREGNACLGDVLVFERETGGHVALYMGEDRTHYHLLGGNQGDRVSIVRRPKEPILGVRVAHGGFANQRMFVGFS